MSIASDAIPALRSHWADRFVDAATLDRETDKGTFNETTGQYDSPTTVEIWDGTGGCLIRPDSRSNPDFGERSVDVERYDVFVPDSATGAAPSDKLTISASKHNPALVGAVLVLTEVVEDSYLTKYLWIAEKIR